MLTLVRGKTRKSTYMLTMHRGTKGSVFIQFRDHALSMDHNDHNCWIYDPMSTDLNDELKKLFEMIIEKDVYRIVFLYGNFNTEETEIVKEFYFRLDSGIQVFVSVQDSNVANNSIIFEDIY